MRQNTLHQVVIDEDDFIEVLYNDDNISNLVVDEPSWVNKFNKQCQFFGLADELTWSVESTASEQDFITENLSDWNLPKEYAELDITSYLLSKCETKEQRDRVIHELNEFSDRDMIMVLRWIAFFVATLRENKMVWGVGRGSSVSSYVLYLLGLHRVDSLKYDLDIKEFLK